MTIVKLLEAHYKAEWNERGRRQCDCGHEFTERYSAEIHRAHAAEVLEIHQREAKAEALEDASRELTHPMYGIIVCDEYCANRTCPDCIRIRAAKDAADWLNHRAGQVRDGL